jgi:hypothetical protein
MAKTRRRISKKSALPIVGKYIDTPTKAEVDVVFFLDDIGTCKVSTPGVADVLLKSYRLQFKHSDLKRKQAFYKNLKLFLDFSSGWQVYSPPAKTPLPLLFGLLKIRKGKRRHFVLVHSADQYIGSKVVNVVVVGIDNLFYLDLLNRIKKNKKKRP